MTTPDFDFPLPYSISMRTGTRYWFHIEEKNRGTWTGSDHRHQLRQGEYQVLASYTGPEGVRLRVRGSGAVDRDLLLISSGDRGVARTGMVTITITELVGSISFMPLVALEQQSLDEATPLVLTIFPQQSFSP